MLSDYGGLLKTEKLKKFVRGIFSAFSFAVSNNVCTFAPSFEWRHSIDGNFFDAQFPDETATRKGILRASTYIIGVAL